MKMNKINCLLVLTVSIVLALFSGSLLAATESKDHAVDVRNLPAKPDASSGMEIARVAQDLEQLEVFVAKLGASKQSKQIRHLYEQVIYVIEGKGHTLMWKNDKAEPVRVDWETGDFFSPPLNSRYQHVNDSASNGVTLFNVTTRPLSEVLYGNGDFMNQVDYSFESIFDEYGPIKEPVFTGTRTEAYDEMKSGLLIKNIKSRELPYNRPGHWGISSLPGQGNGMAGHQLFEFEIFDLEPPSNSPYHRHYWEVVYFVLSGEGAGVFHMEGEQPEYLRFKEGDVFFERSNKHHWHAPLKGQKYRIIQIKASNWFRGAAGLESTVIPKKPADFDKFFRDVSGGQ